MNTMSCLMCGMLTPADEEAEEWNRLLVQSSCVNVFWNFFVNNNLRFAAICAIPKIWQDNSRWKPIINNSWNALCSNEE